MNPAFIPAFTRPAQPPAAARLEGEAFVKGFVMTACLVALQGSPDLRSKAELRRVARRALQGGTALSAATTAARAVQRRDWSRALVAASVGAAGVYLIERLLRDEAGSAPVPHLETKEQVDG